MVQDDGPVGLDGVAVCFDDERAVADAGIVLTATLARRLGIEALVDASVDLGERPGAANVGAKVMTLVSAMALGADCIDDCDLLRAGRTGQVLGHRVAAPSTLGTFLRAFSFGHVRQLDRVLGDTLTRAWAAGAGPGEGRLVVDVDSFVGEVHGRLKQGAAFGYTRRRGYHPLLATRADTGEVLHIRLRKGSANTSRGMLRFCDELIARVERAGATGPKLLRADSGFWSARRLIGSTEPAGSSRSASACSPTSGAQVEQIDEGAWTTLEDYPPTSIAQIAETKLGDRRLVVRRVRTLDRQGELLPSWELFPFATNRTEPLGARRSRAPPARRRRALHPRPQRPGPGALSVGQVHRQRRLDGHRLPGPQPAALDRRPGPARPDHPRRTHPPPPAARAARPPDPDRTPLDVAPAGPLALARRLRRSAHAHPSAPRSRLTATTTSTHDHAHAARGLPLPARAPQPAPDRPSAPPTPADHGADSHDALN